MSLLLVPYNDSMRLGMGFNSYTQALCIDKAVDVDLESAIVVRVDNPSQVGPPAVFPPCRAGEALT